MEDAALRDLLPAERATVEAAMKVTARRDLLLAAAHQASVAAEALLRAARENEPVDEETVDKILDAAKMTIDAEGTDLGGDLGQVYAAIVKFNEGWAG